MKRTFAFYLIIIAAVNIMLSATCKRQSPTTIIIKPDSTIQINPVRDPVRAKKEKEIKEKYGKMLNVPPDSIKNMRLYFFIDQWLNTLYVYGGDSEAGIDCSAFIRRLLAEVYDIHLPRTSQDQFFTKDVERFGNRRSLNEGDLVFFSTTKNKLISHVGLYLANRRFVNAASSKGVSIANLDNLYWDLYYKASGRPIEKKKK